MALVGNGFRHRVRLPELKKPRNQETVFHLPRGSVAPWFLGALICEPLRVLRATDRPPIDCLDKYLRVHLQDVPTPPHTYPPLDITIV